MECNDRSARGVEQGRYIDYICNSGPLIVEFACAVLHAAQGTAAAACWTLHR
eukprot:COSAG02_NODE_1938_length_10312_cov_16.495741_6_plen_52_part_00